MSEMEVSESENDCSNDLMLLDRVFLRLGNADTDEQLENCLKKFLPPVILKLSSSHEKVRTKVMELLVHVNKRVKCRSAVQLPVETLLQNYMDPKANSFIINFSIIYITMGFPRLPKEQQLSIAPTLLEAIENKPLGHQNGILMLIMPILGELKVDKKLLEEKFKLYYRLVLGFAYSVLLLPYRALPTNATEREEFKVPPGMSMKSYKRIVDKHTLTPTQLEEMKLSIVNFIGQDIMEGKEVLAPLVVAAADSRFSVANSANTPLIRVANSVDWRSIQVVVPLYYLYLGTPSAFVTTPAHEKQVPACTRLRLKIIQYLIRGTGHGIMFPHCFQVVFFSLFDKNSNTRLRNLALNFLLHVLQHCEQSIEDPQYEKVGNALLPGMLKVLESEEFAEHHARAFTCLGKLAIKYPVCINRQLSLLEKFVKMIPEAAPELKTAVRDCLLDMAVAYKIDANDQKTMDTSESTAGTSKAVHVMDVDLPESIQVSKRPKKNDPRDEPQNLALLALLDQYMQSEDNMVRYVAMRYASTVFPADYIPSRYLLLLASGDSQDDISNEAKKCLYGSSRSSEIEDVVNNVSDKKSNVVNIDERNDDKNKLDSQTTKIPKFGEMVSFIWDQMQKRKSGSNQKHRFVINNQVLQFHPNTYNEILRYLRMCLNHEAELKDCSNHPNATSPILAKYILNNLLGTDVLEKYLTMITNILSANPDLMSLTCFLDIVGCVPQKMASNYSNLLPFLKNLFVTSTKEEIRETAALIYAIIFVHTKEKGVIDKEISEFVSESLSNKSLESQCGYASASALMCDTCINLSRTTKQFGGKGFSPNNWSPYKEGAVCWGNFLTIPQSMLVSTGCKNIALLGRITALPLPNSTPEEEAKINSENPFDIGISNTNTNDNITKQETLTKFTVVNRLFKMVHNVKLSSKIKEKSLHTLGLLCCGEKFPFAKTILGGFLLMAKDSKEFEIHLQIGEAMVLCVEGVNSNENRNLWTQLPLQGPEKIKDSTALAENNEILEWLLSELFKLGKVTHPHSRQATSVWLLALLKNCADREPILNKLQTFQDMFMDLLSENNDIVQDVSSKGLSLVYQSSDESCRRELVGQIIEQLTSGKRSVTQVTEDTKLFEDGQLGKTPTGGNLSTYKELCSLASDLNQPDLLYKFMHLAHHNSIWNSKKGAAFGFHSIALQAGAQLTEHLPKIVPRLYRYRYDPTPKIQNSMVGIWHALIPETQKTVHKYHKEILKDLVKNLTSNQWRVRMSCCNGLSELLKGAQSLHDSLDELPEIWKQLFRVMDDVHEGTRRVATSAANVLSKLCVRASDANQGKDGTAIVSAVLPVLLDTGITNLVREVRSVSLNTVTKLVEAAGSGVLRGWAGVLVPALVIAAGDLESAQLSYLSAALGADHSTQRVLDDARAIHARRHHTTNTVVQCMPHIDMQTMTDMLPKMLELTKSPQLGTKVACCHFFVLAAQYLRQELKPIAGKIMTQLLNASMDRNITIRKNCAEALGQISAYAKYTSIEKLMTKLVTLNETKDDESTRSVIGLILKAVAKAKLENLKDHEDIIAPMVFLAKHGNKDEEAETVEMFEDIWMDISPSLETGIRENLVPICRYLEEALNSRSWDKKIQAAKAVQTLCTVLPPGSERDQMCRALLAAAHGKTFPGKQHVLHALADITVAKDGTAAISGPLAEEVCDALMVECRKSDPAHRREALLALGVALAALPTARFRQVHDIVSKVLHKDESAIGKDSDEEDNEGARKRREDVTALKEAAYTLLGNAWPKDHFTQEQYELELLEHCSSAVSSGARSTQLCVLKALGSVLPKLHALTATPEHDHLQHIVQHVNNIVDYTLKNVSQIRHRLEALSILETLVKKLKELGDVAKLTTLREMFQKYSADLSLEYSHEIRLKVGAIKELFK